MARQDLESVEFLDPAGNRLADDLDQPPTRRRLPRRWLLGTLVAVLLVVIGSAVVGTRHTRTGTPSAAPYPVPSGDSPVGFFRDVGNLSVLYVGDELYTLSRTRFSYSGRSGVDPSQSYTAFPQLPQAPVRFQADPATGTIFAVTIGTSPTRILEFPSAGAPLAHPLRDITWDVSVRSAASLDGRIVFTTPLGAYQLTPSLSVPTPIPGVAGAVGDVVADPAQHRFILADLGEPAQLWTFDGTTVTDLPKYLDVDNASLAVIGGRQIWIAGTWHGHAVLTSLDPRTLLPSAPVGQQRSFGEQAQIVGTGDHVVWVRAAGTVETYCVDAFTGANMSQLIAAGPMTSTAGQFAVVGGGQAYYARYALGACPG